MSSENPYAAPSVVPPKKLDFELPPKETKKIEVIIKDANQFWLAIIICIFCSAIASIIIPIWYGIRLIQHSGWATKYPKLTEPAEGGSLPYRFQAAKTKLIIGLSVSGVIAALIVASIVVMIVTGV